MHGRSIRRGIISLVLSSIPASSLVPSCVRGLNPYWTSSNAIIPLGYFGVYSSIFFSSFISTIFPGLLYPLSLYILSHHENDCIANTIPFPTQPPSFLYARSSISAYATKLLGGAGGNITSMVICFPAISQLQTQILTLLSKSTTFCWYIFPFTFQVLTTSLSHHLSLSGNDFTSYFIEKIESNITLKNN